MTSSCWPWCKKKKKKKELGVRGLVKWLKARCEREYGFLVDYRAGMGEGG